MTDEGSLFDFHVDLVNLDLPERFAGLIEQFPDLIPRFVQNIAEQHEGSLLEIVKVTPGEPVSPWPWVSQKQAVAFHFTDGFGKGIPHQRGGPGSIEESWHVEVNVQDDTTSQIVVQNEAINLDGLPYAGFVMGWDSQPGFIATGWLQVPDVMELILDQKESMFQDFALLADDALTNWRAAD